jgi:hypothetical protein
MRTNNDPVAGMLDQITTLVGSGMRPPPSTIWALRRLNGALAKLGADNGLAPEAFEKELGFTVQPPPEHA